MVTTRSSRCQGARGHRVGASGSVLAQRGPQPAPQPGSAWLGARRAAGFGPAGASTAAWQPPAPPGRQKLRRRRGCAGRNPAGADPKRQSHPHAPTPASAFSLENSPLGAKSAKSRRRRGGPGTHRRTDLHLVGIVPAPAHGAGTGLQRGPASFPPDAAVSGCEPWAAVGCKPLSGSAACRGASGLGCSPVPRGRVLLQGQELGPPSPVLQGPLQGSGPSAGTQENGGGGLQNSLGVGDAARAQRKV